MKFKKIPLFLLALFLSACGRLPSVGPTSGPAVTLPASTPSTFLPDLVVSHVFLGMHGIAGGWIQCVPQYAPYEIRARVQNLGPAAANNISVIEHSTNEALQIGELVAGQSIELAFPTSPSGSYSVSVDSQNTIAEGNEDNNTFSYLAITPTPPALCLSPETPSPVPPTAVPPGESGSAELSPAVLRNNVYRSPDWGEFQLTDGVYYRPPPTSQESAEIYITRIQDQFYYADLNADGVEDALVFLNTQNGGTGHFIEMAAVLNQNGSASNVSTISLGDRVVVESGQVENGVIRLNMRVQGPNDGMCCPSQLETWSFTLSENRLVKQP